ncbi:MAG: GspH/FimT family pseudopilin [Xanthomonadales bacterium]|nr:GspH/FimT family pseudopilin [Xanthomonadales bacterium]
MSLIELLAGIAVVAVLLGIAIPGYRGSVDATNATTTRASILNSVQRAITQATLTNTRTVLCPSGNGNGCDGGADWSQGWIGFIDRNGNREHDAGDFLLDRVQALPEGVRMTTSVGRTRLVFQPSGGNGGSNVRFTICDRRGPSKAQSLVLNNKGRLHGAPPLDERLAATCPQT